MDLKRIHQQTNSVYQENAQAWDEQRPKLFFEKTWMDRLLKAIPPRASILDVGCGASDPIGKYFIEQGCRLTGIDASEAMIAISAARFPDAKWQVMDMRELSLPDRYDGILSWDGFFHLNYAEQKHTLQLFSRHLRQGGALLLTIGDQAGEVVGMVNGQQVYHSSLDPDEYRSLLIEMGFNKVDIVLQDKKCDDHSILLASDYQGQ